jgi:excisionase family DNA binding protein
MALALAFVPTWRSLDDAAQQTGISRRTLTRWISEGKLTAYSRAGDRRRYVDLDHIRKLQELRPLRQEGR